MALSAEEELVVREWAPLNYLFQKLPHKHQGIFSSDLKLTCIDVVSELIVLGTNQGIIYCYNRNTHHMERLKCENINSPITCIKVISTVDYMLACGNREGNINIFQIPKMPSEALPMSLRPREKQVERYTVSDMHKGQVTALEWSKNGMKLFSGDMTGHVVLTEIDFYMHLCKSSEILDESYQVVQLNYLQQRLLVSTTYRSIICQKVDRWKVCQVGKKDRKVLGMFGGTILQNGLRPTDLTLYCSRPGLRIWQAQLSGDVDKTVLFKDSLSDASSEIFVLNPRRQQSTRSAKPQHSLADPSFGVIYQFHKDYLVTFNAHRLYILKIAGMKCVGQVSQLRGILDVAVHKDEIFVLEGERSLIRISPFPEDEQPPMTTPLSNPLTTSLREFGNKLQQSSIVTAEPTKTAFPLESAAIATAEEALEAKQSPKKTPMSSPRRVGGDEASSVYQIYRKLEVYNKIAEQDYDDVIQYTHKQKKRKKKKEFLMTGSICSFSSNSSDERNDAAHDFTIRPTLMNISNVGLLSPDTLQHDINAKENLLAEILNFDSVKVDLNRLELTEDTVADVEEDTRPEVDQFEQVPADVKEEEQPIEKTSIPPACKTLPNAWAVNKVNLVSVQQDNDQLSDWEIL